MYAIVLKYKIVEKLYSALLAGLEYNIYAAEKGLIIKVCFIIFYKIYSKIAFNHSIHPKSFSTCCGFYIN